MIADNQATLWHAGQRAAIDRREDDDWEPGPEGEEFLPGYDLAMDADPGMGCEPWQVVLRQ